MADYKELRDLGFKYLLEEKWANGVMCLDVGAEEIKSLDPTSFIGVTDALQPSQVLDVALDQKLSHVVQTSNLGLKEELNVSALMIKEKDAFFNFPVSSILHSGQASLELETKMCAVNTPFRSSAEKQDALQLVQKFLRSFCGANEYISEVCLLADELCSNALYNAPYIGGKIREDKSRPTRMPFGKNAILKVARNDRRIVVACEDPFGSLDIPTLLKRVKSCYGQLARDKVEISKGSIAPRGGAGLGGFLIYNTSCSLYLAVQKGVKTIVCAAIPMGTSQRRRATIPKNIHCFEVSP